MADLHQLRSGFGSRSVDGAAIVVSLELVVVVVVDGEVCDMLDELLSVLGAVVDGLVDGVDVVLDVVLESAGRVAGSLVDCA